MSDVAVGFLEAFRSGELASVRPFACPTFRFGTTARVNPCTSSAKTPEELERLLGCVRADALLQRELESASHLAESVEPLSELPRWVVSLVPATDREQSAASAYINGDGVTFSFVLLAQDKCIDWFLLDTYFESG